jgi:hypothetical protein
MNGIHKIWLKDENRRVYQDDQGNKTSTPNERHYWVECEVVSETSRSYIVKYRGETKVPKNRELIVGDWVAFSEAEVESKVFKATNAHKIAEKVRSLDSETLKQVAYLIGYIEQPDSEIEARIAEVLETAKTTHKSDDPLVHICWLIQGIDIHQKTDGKRGHSIQDAQRYVISNILRMRTK